MTEPKEVNIPYRNRRTFYETQCRKFEKIEKSRKVVLWFAEGSMDNWDASKLTYTDGTNSVKVSGVTADLVTLKFGDDGSDEYNALASAGAFFDATTEHIFEEEGKGMLASL